MKILAIGDPHGDLKKIKKIPIRNIDLILLTGDLGSAHIMRKIAFENIERTKKGLPKKEFSNNIKKKGFMEAYNSSIKLIKYLSKFAPVYTIYGNVESSNSETKKTSKEINYKLPFLTNTLRDIKNVKIINNKKLTFKNVKIGGLEYFLDTSWVYEFSPNNKEKLKTAKKESKKAKKYLKKFNSLDILLTHQPPYKILDKVNAKFAPKHWQGKHAGSKVILDYIKKHRPNYVFCGHIHEARGFKKLKNTKIYNLGSGDYKIIEV